MTTTRTDNVGGGAASALTRVEQLSAEGLIGMRAAARIYGESKDGKAPHSSTPTRHAINGVKLPDGRVIKLESLRIAGRLMTTRAAVLRFFAAQNDDDTPPTTSPAPATPRRRTREQAAASEQLDKILG